MPQSLAQIYLHIVFSTKNREPFLVDLDIRARVHAHLATVCHTLGSPALQVGGVADHVHLLCRFGRTVSVADLLRDLKRDSTKWIQKIFPGLRAFNWQNGYGAFSISPSHVNALMKYIAKQEEHHQTASFQDEFRILLRKYGIDCDERYVWD